MGEVRALTQRDRTRPRKPKFELVCSFSECSHNDQQGGCAAMRIVIEPMLRSSRVRGTMCGTEFWEIPDVKPLFEGK